MTTQLGPENVIGRDELIEQIWRCLNSSSVRFTAERRIGKTTVMQKMRSEPPEGVLAIYIDLEKIDTPERFVEVLMQKVSSLLPTTDKAKRGFQELLSAVEGAEIGGIVKLPKKSAEHWQSAMEKTFSCISKNHKASSIVFLFDELPYMLQKISVLGGVAPEKRNNALNILDSLRAIRAENHNVRMVFCGSIGLHHVVHTLRDQLYASQPLNDMDTIEIGPLDRCFANDLAEKLIDAEELNCSNRTKVRDEIVKQTDCVPFYIERVIRRLAISGKKQVTPTLVKEQVNANLTNDMDHWEMEHFRERLKVYYPVEVEIGGIHPIPLSTIALKVLDVLALAEHPKSISQIHNLIKAELPLEDRQVVINLLKNLCMDHYLISDCNKNYSFRFPLIKTWWKLAQGLTS